MTTMFRSTLPSIFKFYQVVNVNASRNISVLCSPKMKLKNIVSSLHGQKTTTRLMTTKLNTVNFDEVQEATKDEDVYIIDVREPEELQQTGIIPNSINIPLASVESTLKNFSDENFAKKFGRAKPKPDAEIIFSCRSGKRAETAANTALHLGYKKLKVYSGSWTDWEQRIKQ